MPHTPTVTVHFSQAILQAARRLGLPLPKALVADIERQGRVELAQQDRLWEQFCTAADDPLVGLELGLALQVGHLDTAGLILMSCETLGEAVDALLDYHPIVGEGSRFRLHQDGTRCRLSYQPGYQTCREARVEAAMASLLHLTRWSTGEHFQADAVTFSHRPLAAVSRYQERLGLPVTFEADDNALVFHRQQLVLPLIHANPALCQHLRDLGDQLLARLGSHSLGAQVRALVREQPRWGKERIAEKLGMSGRHLVRKLADEDTSFKLLRNALLRERAEQALTEGRRLADIADDLGFSDESAFAKAFKRWTGLTPARYRNGSDAPP